MIIEQLLMREISLTLFHTCFLIIQFDENSGKGGTNTNFVFCRSTVKQHEVKMASLTSIDMRAGARSWHRGGCEAQFRRLKLELKQK